MQLYPAIDLRDGKCVRLYQGDFAQQTTYGDDPVAQAQAFVDEGARWIHVVDLDAARTGEAHNLEVIRAICGAVAVPVQSGGGVRDRAKAEALFDAGVHRVVIGTAALENPGFVTELASAHTGGVAVGLDARRRTGRDGEPLWDVAVRGWEAASGRSLFDVIRAFEDREVASVVVTEIGRDGTMDGPDLEGLGRVLEATTIEVVASGGVGSLAHLRELAALEANWRRLSGVIVGRSLYEGAFRLADALAAVRPASAD